MFLNNTGRLPTIPNHQRRHPKSTKKSNSQSFQMRLVIQHKLTRRDNRFRINSIKNISQPRSLLENSPQRITIPIARRHPLRSGLKQLLLTEADLPLTKKRRAALPATKSAAMHVPDSTPRGGYGGFEVKVIGWAVALAESNFVIDIQDRSMPGERGDQAHLGIWEVDRSSTLQEGDGDRDTNSKLLDKLCIHQISSNANGGLQILTYSLSAAWISAAVKLSTEIPAKPCPLLKTTH